MGLALVAGQCDKDAIVGLSTPAIIEHVQPHEYRWAIISAGSNDMPQPRLRQHLGRNLYVLRGRVRAANVVWVLPVHPFAAARVREVASAYGDAVVSFIPGPDGLHAKNYHRLWHKIKES